MGVLSMLEKNAKAKAICESDETDKLEELITDLMSDSNDTRSDAKSIFEFCRDKPDPQCFANKLYRVLSSPLDLNSCTISAILLRKSLIIKSYVRFLSFPFETQSTLKRDLLKLVDTPARPINKELCHTVSALAASLLSKKEWPEFLSFLFELVESNKKRALLIVAYLAQYLGKGLNKLHLDKELHSVNLDKRLRSILLECWKTTTEEDVGIAALGAAINLILCLEQKDLVDFQDLLLAMKNLLYSGNETMADAVNMLKLLIDLAGMKPMFLRKQIVEMVKTIMLMADDHSLEKETRRLAIELVLTLVQFVLTLAEVEKTNPRQLKLGTEFEIKMEKMWDDNEETDNYGSWQGCVDRLAILSDRNDILIVALKVFPAYLAAPKGQKRHAALIALSKSIIKWNCRECLEKEKEWDVRVVALEAAINFFLCPDLLTSMLSMLEKVLEDRDEAMAGEVLELLTKLVEPRFLVGQIEDWVKRMWQIVNNDSLNLGTRCLAIEFLSKLAHVEEIAPWLQQNVRKLFEIMMNMLDYINDYGPYADYVYAWWSSNHWRWRKCLNMLFIEVGRNDMFSVVLEVLPTYLDAPEWQKKYSALIVLTQSIESCGETQVTIENLKQVVPMVLSPFPNAHRRVRRAAIEAIQQFLTHLLCFRLHEEVMRTNFEQVMSMLLSLVQDHDLVVQNASIGAIGKLASTLGELQVGCDLVLLALAEVMNDSPNQEMQARVASIILDFSKYCTRDNLREHFGIISSYLIVSKVEEIAHWLQQNVRELFEILMNTWDYINDDDPNADYVSAWESSNHWRECLNMMFLAVGRNDMFSVILEVLPAYLDAPEWQKKYSAFIVLAQSIKSCREEPRKCPFTARSHHGGVFTQSSQLALSADRRRRLISRNGTSSHRSTKKELPFVAKTQVTTENLEQVVPMVLSPFPNAHRPVRRAAIEAIQQFLTHLLCFCSHEEVMRTNFEQVISMLLSSFQDDDPVVQNASIRAVGELASTLGKHLQVGCDLVLPALAEVMNDSPNQDMRGSAASAILVFSEYCTRDNLREHLDEIISNCLIVSQEVKKFVTTIGLRPDRLSPHDMPSWRDRLSKAWVQLWQNQERDFSPYLKILMSPVFDAAQLDPNVTQLVTIQF